MSIDIVQKDVKLRTGWINIMGKSWPSLGILPTPRSKSINGLAFTTKEQVKEVIEFLKKALEDMP